LLDIRAENEYYIEKSILGTVYMATITEIAKLSGVSRLTASKVIRNKEGVSEATRQKVLRVVRDNNYSPKVLSHAPQAQFSKIVGVITRDYSNPFYHLLLRGMGRRLENDGYVTMQFNSVGRIETLLSGIKSFIEYLVGGLVLTPCDHPEDLQQADEVRELAESRIPVVTLGRIPGISTHCMEFDDLSIGRMSARYLLGRGHRRVFHLAGPPMFPSARDRRMGFVDALLEAGLGVSEGTVLETDGSIAGGERAANAILSDRPEFPIALSCFNDSLAIGVFRAARKHGLDIPGKISIIGCDNAPMAEMLSPGLTTMDISAEQVGWDTADIIVSQIEGTTSEKMVNRLYRPQLVERGSVLRLT
jgi:DNA-binding LacI/PurR family transcriptional regulator